MKRTILAIGFLGLTLAFGAAAQENFVATVTDTDGKVQVNQGEGFAPATEGQRLKPGDRVMAQNDSDADIKYDDECQLNVEENSIVTIPEKSPCAGGVPLVQQLNPGSGSAIGSTGGATGTGNGGVWAMVAIVAAIDLWWLNEGDDDEIVSP